MRFWKTVTEDVAVQVQVPLKLPLQQIVLQQLPLQQLSQQQLPLRLPFYEVLPPFTRFSKISSNHSSVSGCGLSGDDIANPKGDVCCPYFCGSCGESGCSTRPGGRDNCCRDPIREAGQSCLDHPAPCVLHQDIGEYSFPSSGLPSSWNMSNKYCRIGGIACIAHCLILGCL